MFDLSKESFDAAVRLCGGEPWAQPFEHARLMRAYAQTQRAYHTTQHLAECMAHLALANAENPAEIALALWYHDAIYRPQRSDNEVRSARWFRFRAQQFGIAPNCAKRLSAMILATQHGAALLPGNPQTHLLLDIDLAILAAATQRFQQYCAQIGREYAFVPAAIFKQKRAQVLSEFLLEKRIYLSPFGVKFEIAARQNLTIEISNLLGRGETIN